MHVDLASKGTGAGWAGVSRSQQPERRASGPLRPVGSQNMAISWPKLLSRAVADTLRHENIISILDIILPKSYTDFVEVYLVQELMETDL